MALQRITAGTHREIWRDTVTLDGGGSVAITTGIHASTAVLDHVFGILQLQQPIVGAPTVTSTLSVSLTGFLVVTLSNTAPAGNSAFWQLDVTLFHSIQQGRSSGQGAIYVVGSGGTALATLRNAYNFGSVAADQTLPLLDSKGGGVVIDGSSGSFTGADSLHVIGLASVLGNKTIAVPAAGSHWDAIHGEPSALTLNPGGAAPNALAFCRIEAPLIHTGAAGYVVPMAASLMIDGEPTYDGAGWIRSPIGFWIKNATPVDTHGINNVDLMFVAYGVNTLARLSQYDANVYWGDMAVAMGDNEYGCINKFIKSRSTDGSTPSIVHNGDMVALIEFGADDGVDLKEAVALIKVTVDGTPVQDKVPGRMIFATTKEGEEGPVEVVRITPTHHVLIGQPTDATDIVFNVNGSTRLYGGLTVRGTDINAAGPYNVAVTDFCLEVRYTATGAIQINLPAISTVGNGRVIVVIDSGYNAAANNITVARNGADKINNIAGNYTMNTSGDCKRFKSNSTTSNWELI